MSGFCNAQNRVCDAVFSFLVNYVEERLCGLYKAPTKKEERRKRKAKRREREIRSNLLILDLNDGKLKRSGQQECGKTFHELHILGMNEDLRDRICGVGSETWKECE